MFKFIYLIMFSIILLPVNAEEKCKDTRTPDIFFKEEFTKSFYAINNYQMYLESMGYKKIYCLPPELKINKLVDVFVKYYTDIELLNQMPRASGLEGDNLQPAFGDMIAYVLTKHYPCK